MCSANSAYGSYQLAKEGLKVTSFEVAESRRQYAIDKLAVTMVSDMDDAVRDLEGKFDCFFNAHVIEHVPSPVRAFDYALRLLKTNGLFISFCPNGCKEHKANSPKWSKLWGEVHPNFIDEIFLEKSFSRSPRSIGSSPITNASIANDLRMKRINKLENGELFFVAQKISDSWD
jgi:SAM-dependent methyltransferase